MVEEYRAKDAPPREETPPPANGPHRYRYVFHGPPVTAPGGHVPMMLLEEIADDLARHIELLSFRSYDDLVAMADENGMVRVSALPKPKIRQEPPPAGPAEWVNPGPWVPVDAPRGAAVPREVNLNNLTDEQAEAMRVEAEAVQEALERREAIRRRLQEGDE